jgi:ATP-dependent DNA helicase RecG
MALHINLEDLLSARTVESDRIEFKEGWNPDAILLYNSGGPDRSIKREDFMTGKAIPKRYRNRRLGDFLKELKLTEGHATGLPAIRRAMKQNGSPEPLFDFDEERTWFQVTLPIHTSFVQKLPYAPDLNKVKWDLKDIDTLLDQILDYADLNEASGIAGDIAEVLESSNNLAVSLVKNFVRDIAGDIAGGIAGGIVDKMIQALELSKLPISRTEIMGRIGLVNNVKNYNSYIAPLVSVNWLAMTIPGKPTSPKQQYITTLKGRLVLELLKHGTRKE